MKILETLFDENGHTFDICERPRLSGSGHDPIHMYEYDAEGVLVKDWGTHAWLKGARKFAASRGFC